MIPDSRLSRACRAIMEKMPATLPGRSMDGRGARWTPRLSQREVDIIYAALSHHAIYCECGRHEDAESPEIVQRLSRRLTKGGARLDQIDPYAGYSPALREFCERMDLYTLEEVIVRVMTEIDRRRRKYLGGYEGMYQRHTEAAKR